MTGTDRPAWRERCGQTEPAGPREGMIVDLRDLDAVNSRLLDPNDPDTLRRLLAGLRTLNPDRPATEETET